MSAVWVAIQPQSLGTRILATAGSQETLLKARLGRAPQHPRALATLLEALALWQGAEVRAALAVADPANSCVANLWPECCADFGRAPLYTLDVVDARRRLRPRDHLGGMGAYRDLRQLLVDAVAR